MNQTQTTQTTTTTTIVTAIGALSVIEAFALFVGAVAHLGVEIPIGLMVLTEPRIIYATIVEGLCGLGLAGGAYAAFTRKPWAWKALVAGQAVALGGILLGLVVTMVSPGPNTASNALFHRVMLVVLVGGLIVLLIPRIQSAVDRSDPASPPRSGE